MLETRDFFKIFQLFAMSANSMCLFLYGPLYHGALQHDPVCLVCNILSLNISSMDTFYISEEDFLTKHVADYEIRRF